VRWLPVLLLSACAVPRAAAPEVVATFSIVAYDPATGDRLATTTADGLRLSDDEVLIPLLPSDPY